MHVIPSSKAIVYTTVTVGVNINHGHGVIMLCQCRFTNGNKYITLGKSLYFCELKTALKKEAK